MYMFDTSSMVYAWDDYPKDQFSCLWDWMGEQIKKRELRMSETVYNELEGERYQWIKQCGLKPDPNTDTVARYAAQIESKLGKPKSPEQNIKGVSANDILIIAAVIVLNQNKIVYSKEVVLVSNEGKQFNIPGELYNYKIPLVCASLPTLCALPKIRCINFAEYLKESKSVFC